MNSIISTLNDRYRLIYLYVPVLPFIVSALHWVCVNFHPYFYTLYSTMHKYRNTLELFIYDIIYIYDIV